MSDRNIAVIESYKGLMQEVKARDEAVASLLENRGELSPAIVRECAYLQLRMMAELVALACVVAHDDLTLVQLKRLRKTYHAADILDALETNQPHFFPQAMTSESMVGSHHLTGVEGCMDKAELKKLWEACGRYLHKGTVNQLAIKQPVEKDFSDVRGCRDRLMSLMREHTIILRANEKVLLCMMYDPSRGNGVTVAVAEAPA